MKLKRVAWTNPSPRRASQTAKQPSRARRKMDVGSGVVAKPFDLVAGQDPFLRTQEAQVVFCHEVLYLSGAWFLFLWSPRA